MIISHFWKTCHFFFKVYLQYRVAELTSCQLFYFPVCFWILSYIRWKCETIGTCDERPSCKQMSFMMVFTNEIVYYKFPKLAWKKSLQFMVFLFKGSYVKGYIYSFFIINIINYLRLFEIKQVQCHLWGRRTRNNNRRLSHKA